MTVITTAAATVTAAANTTAAALLEACQAAVRRVLGDTLPKDATTGQAYTAFDALWATRPMGFNPSTARRVLASVLSGVNPGYGLTYRGSKLAAASPTPPPAPVAAPVAPKPEPVAAPAPTPVEEAQAAQARARIGATNPLDLVDAAFAQATCEGHVVVLLESATLNAETARKRIAAAKAEPKPAAPKVVETPKPAAPVSKPAAPVAPPVDRVASIKALAASKDATMGQLRNAVDSCGLRGVGNDARQMRDALTTWAAGFPASPAPVAAPKPAAAPVETPKPAAPKAAPVVVKATRTAAAIAESIDGGDKLCSLKTTELATLATLYDINPAAPEFEGKGGRSKLVSAVADARKALKAKAREEARKAAPGTEPAPVKGMSEAVRGLLRELRSELAGNSEAQAALDLVEDAASR